MKSDKNFERFLEEIGQKVQIFRKGSLVTETIASIQSCKGFFKKEVDIKVGDEIIVEVSGERLIVEKAILFIVVIMFIILKLK